MLNTLALVAFGGALGSAARYLVGTAVAFPFGTLSVNVIGSFAIGALWASQMGKTDGWGAFVLIGVLGGFTTFSSFSLDVLRLAADGRFGAAGAYVLASVALSLAAVFAGLMLMRGVP
ncbi:MAG: CrcB family protein [Pseudomonadota bacterium]